MSIRLVWPEAHKVWRFRPGGFEETTWTQVQVNDVVLYHNERRPVLTHITSIGKNPFYPILGVDVLYMKPDGPFPQRTLYGIND